jgi:hypothetical protein
MAPGVALSRRLIDRWPEEMTIVLQNQFSDLRVYEDRFEVMLSFDRIPERLVITFESIKVFFDPSVPFGHQFEQSEQIPMVRLGEPSDTVLTDRVDQPHPPARPEPSSRPLPAEGGSGPGTARPVKVDGPKAEPPKEAPSPGKVVELDAFRKK